MKPEIEPSGTYADIKVFPLGKKTSSYQEAYSTLKCVKCKRSGYRLYRLYGNFFKPEEVYCNEHIPQEHADWFVPVFMSHDGAVVGYFKVVSMPQVEQMFLTLPDVSTDHPRWVSSPQLDEEQQIRSHWIKPRRSGR